MSAPIAAGKGSFIGRIAVGVPGCFHEPKYTVCANRKSRR
jgi:hypothetical protein